MVKKPLKTYKLKLNRSISSFLTKKTNVKVTDVNKSATLKNIGSNKLKSRVLKYPPNQVLTLVLLVKIIKEKLVKAPEQRVSLEKEVSIQLISN